MRRILAYVAVSFVLAGGASAATAFTTDNAVELDPYARVTSRAPLSAGSARILGGGVSQEVLRGTTTLSQPSWPMPRPANGRDSAG